MHWIDVNDRLPEEDELVLAAVTGRDKNENIEWEDAYLLARFYPEEGWYLEDHWEATDFTIRWWMRLPEDVPDGKTVRANADRIRSMSDEELARWLAEHRAKESFMRVAERGTAPTGASRHALVESLYETYLNWLRQTSKED